jgi:hypothetical protein
MFQSVHTRYILFSVNAFFLGGRISKISPKLVPEITNGCKTMCWELLDTPSWGSALNIYRRTRCVQIQVTRCTNTTTEATYVHSLTPSLNLNCGLKYKAS